MHSKIEDPGQKLRAARERLQLRYRDVEEASQIIADQRGNHEFSIGLSRLADIENKGTVPSMFRLYSLCAIYRLDFSTVLHWYGIDLENFISDAAGLSLGQTHLANMQVPDTVQIDFPAELDEEVDLRQTSYLARQVRRWGKLPVALLNRVDVSRQRYAFIGTDDWSMYPVLWPGSFIEIDETKRRVAKEGWTHEHDRPIYFIEHRSGFRCGWCTEQNGLLIVMAHSASQLAPDIFRFPGEADVIGQVVAVAMRLDPAKRRHTRS
jgi:transcriptional regulator with XRE-family HTH domain